MNESVDAILAHMLIKWGLPGMALLGTLALMAIRMGWVKFTPPSFRRKDDDVIRDLTLIVKENTAAFVALKSTMEDNKGITIKVANTLDQVHTALAGLSGHIQGALQFMAPESSVAHHRERGRAGGT